MSEIRIEYEPGALSKLTKQLNDLGNKMPNALRNAVNSTASQARDDLKNKATSVYTVGKREVQRSVSLTRARQSATPEATINVKGGVLSLTQYKTSSAKRKGASAAVKGSTKKQLVGSRGIKAFKGTAEKLHNQIYQREGKSRLPIKRLSGPSIPNIYREDGEVYKAVEPSIQDNLRKNLETQVKKYMKQM